MLGLDIRTVGDMGELSDSLPVFLVPDIPLNFETLPIMGARTHSPLRSLVFGSKTSDLLRASRVPTLLLR